MIPAPLCREIIARFETDARKAPGRAGGANPMGKRTVDLGLRGLPEWTDLCRQLDEPITRSLKRYRDDVPNFRDIHRGGRDTGYLMQRYEPNGSDGFDWHADVAALEVANRFLAMVAYLNTVETGGETEFRAQQLAIAPREGAILWFPPGFEYVHRGKPPVSGRKYVITSFLVYA